MADVAGIKSLIDHYAKKRLLLPRSIADIATHIRDFLVFEEKKRIVGCVALHFCWTDLAEIRSLSVKETMQGSGIGTELLHHALEEAKQLQAKKVFTLTSRQDFFEKNGFKKVEKSELPQKVWTECINCPLFPDCNEVALAKDLL